MKRRLSKSLVAAFLGTSLALAGSSVAARGAAASTTSHAGTWKFTSVISGLNGPRGIAFDNRGNLYVAEAGQFQNVTGTAFVVNQTGKVDKFALGPGTAKLKWSASFNSVSDTFLGGGPEVLGPTGVTTDGNNVLALVSQSQAGVHKITPGLPVPQIGHLFKLNAATGKAVSRSDIGDQEYQWTADHASLWQEFPDANPNAVLIADSRHHDRTFVVDAGANTVAEVLPNGKIHIIAFIPNDRLRDSTPTCVTQGPDGALYVGTLDLVDNLTFGPGQSRVFRIDPNTRKDFLHAATVWATGLTTVFGCTFDRHGIFWATEILAPNNAGAPGDVVRIPFRDPSALEHIGLGSVPTPGGIALGPDGRSMYVATGAPDATPNAGGVLKITAG
jgi:hypothetical protein